MRLAVVSLSDAVGMDAVVVVGLVVVAAAVGGDYCTVVGGNFEHSVH